MFCRHLFTAAKIILAAIISICLSGCIHKPVPHDVSTMTEIKPLTEIKNRPPLPDSKALAEKSELDTEHNLRLAHCTHELEALKTYSPAQYKQEHREFIQLTQRSAKYLEVSADISSDINQLVRPKYQFALASLCYRIRNDLTLALINQVKMND